jgi:hypothetical protein
MPTLAGSRHRAMCQQRGESDEQIAITTSGRTVMRRQTHE